MLDWLKRWSELESDRCSEGDRLEAADPILFQVSSPRLFQRWVDPLDLSFRSFATIESAVRAAIVARKLRYRIENDEEGIVHVLIRRPGSSASWKASHSESAIALLIAYLQYLESFTSQWEKCQFGCVRQCQSGKWWFLNHKVKGWNSFGFGHKDLEALQEAHNVRVLSEAPLQDSCGVYFEYEKNMNYWSA